MYNYNKYHKYQLTHPIEGNIVIRTRDIDKAIKRCYDEFKSMQIESDYFIITDLDENTEYKFELDIKKE